MSFEIIIRDEQQQDVQTIHQVIAAAFKDHPYSDQQEPMIVEKLRASSALDVSLVAEVNGELVGHITFSKVTINGEFIHWYGLAPVAVKPEFQSKGIGKQLITAGLAEIKALNAKGCVLLGEPEYYGKFGFKAVDGLTLDGVPPEYFQALLFNGDMPVGNVKYHSAFA